MHYFKNVLYPTLKTRTQRAILIFSCLLISGTRDVTELVLTDRPQSGALLSAKESGALRI